MTIEQTIVQYLYSNKKVTLQNIGEFTFISDTVISSDNEANIVLPENSIEFKYNSHAQEDIGLIEFIIQNTKKIRSLASSDLESYTVLNKQFLNIGKPYTIEGIGVLHKVQDGSYTFEQATTSQVMAKDNIKVDKVKSTEKVKEKISFNAPRNEKSNSNIPKLVVIGLLAVLTLGGLCYGGYYLYKNYESNKTETAEKAKLESLDNEKMDSTKLVQNNVIKDTNSFYIVIKEFQNYDIAQMRLKKLLSFGNNVSLHTTDSITYKLRMPFKLQLADTLRAKDSLAKFFSAKTYVELPL